MDYFTQDREADYFLFISITSSKNNSTIEKIRCKVFLPRNYKEPVLLQFVPTTEQLKIFENDRLSDFWKFSIYGEYRETNGDLKTVSANNVYMQTFKVSVWADDLRDTYIIAEATDLMTVHHHKYPEVKPEGNFWITPNIMLKPFGIHSSSYDGTREIEVSHSITFTLCDELNLDFREHFQNEKDTEYYTKTTTKLVAESDIWGDLKASQRINESTLADLSDFLLLVSFATRQRCVCVGWETYDSIGHTRFYRKSISIPNFNKNHSMNDTLIIPENFEEFLKHAYTRFQTDMQQKLLRSALWGAMNDRKVTVEGDFTRLFSALETLILLFRRKNNLEYIFSNIKKATLEFVDDKGVVTTENSELTENEEWQRVDKNLRKWLKDQPLLKGKAKSNRRNLIYNKLGELKRIPFSYAFDEFCKYFNLDLTDLWNLKGGEGNMSLTDIRNKLVHGDELGEYKNKWLFTAQIHLEWMLERCLLAYLEWDLEKSSVRKSSISNHSAYKNLKKHQELISID